METCPTNVRVFGDLDDPDSEASKLLRTRATEGKKIQAGTGPNLYYIIGHSKIYAYLFPDFRDCKNPQSI